MADANDTQEFLATLTADIVSAHVSNNSVAPTDLPGLIQNVFHALASLGGAPVVVEEKPVPAVSIRSSVKADHIVCLEDGKKLKMLKRHLMTHYGMTPDDYRTRWGLPADTRWSPPIMPKRGVCWRRRSAWVPRVAAVAASRGVPRKSERRRGTRRRETTGPRTNPGAFCTGQLPACRVRARGL